MFTTKLLNFGFKNLNINNTTNITNVFYIIKRHQMYNKINFNNFIEYNQPMIIEYTPNKINIEYLVGCCEKNCTKCKFSNNYDKNAKDCCGKDCYYCPDNIIKTNKKILKVKNT